MYMLNSDGSVLRDDGAYIPSDSENTDYQAYLEWVQGGNTPGSATVAVESIKFVTMRQARLALLAAGKLAAVKSAVAAAPEYVQISWECAGTVERDNSVLTAMAAQLGWTDSEIDNLFTEAAKL
jgi:hypothetical protein